MTLSIRDVARIFLAAAAIAVVYELAAHAFMLSMGLTGADSWSWAVQGLFRAVGVL